MLSWKEKQLLNRISQWDSTTDIQERSRVIVIGIATERARKEIERLDMQQSGHFKEVDQLALIIYN